MLISNVCYDRKPPLKLLLLLTSTYYYKYGKMIGLFCVPKTTLILINALLRLIMQSYLKSTRNKKVNWIGFDVMLVSKDLALLSNHYRYYPYHYAPFLSDVRNVSSLTLTFDLGKPFMPFEQLLGVLPSASKDLLPQCYQVPHTLHVPVMSVFVRNSPSFTDFFTASDDITGLTHC